MNKTTAYKIFFIALIMFFMTNGTHSETISEINSTIRRLPPSAFSGLSQEIIRALESRGCTIPQVYDDLRPHNVIHGEFIKKGQKDLAVLCSREQISTILIFQGGVANKVLEIASSPDEKRLQTFADGQYGYSREIMTAGKKQIIQYNKNAKEFGVEQDLPQITHDGIDDIFVNKASVVHYYYKGQWQKLLGSD